MYFSCKVCKSGVITVLDEIFCQKCNKATETFKRVVLNLKLKGFAQEVKLFQDNIACLLSSDINNIDNTDIEEAIEPFKHKQANFLVLKRAKNNNIDYIILDITFGQFKKPAL